MPGQGRQQQQHSGLPTQQQQTAHTTNIIDAPGDVLIDFGSLDEPVAAGHGSSSSASPTPAADGQDTPAETPFAAPAAQAAAPASLSQPGGGSTAAAGGADYSSSTGGGSSSTHHTPHAAATAAPALGPHQNVAHAHSNFLDTRRFHSQHFWLSEGRQAAAEHDLRAAAAAGAAGQHTRASSGSFEDFLGGLGGSITEESDSISGSPTKQSLLQHWRQHQQQQRNLGPNFGSDLGGGLSPINSVPTSAADGSSSFTDSRALNASFGVRRRSSLSYSHGPGGASFSLSGPVPHSGLVPDFVIPSDAAEAPAGAAAGAAADGSSGSGNGPGAAARSKMRWQKATERVVQLNKAADTFKPWGLQGLDVKRHNYSEMMRPLHTEVEITVADYSNEQVQVVGSITNDSLSLFLDKPRPEWSKVRWLNVQGLSWDVIQTLAVAYDLHPLSVEDIVHVPQRIKADYYQNYLYASVLLLSVEQPSQLTAAAPLHSDLAAAAAAALDLHMEHGSLPQSPVAGRTRTATRLGSLFAPQLASHANLNPRASPPPRLQRLRTRLLRPSRSRAHVAETSNAALHSMELMVEQASLFLFRDGTVITMFSNEGEGVAENILERLKGFKTLLTDSEDASFLFNTILDAVVDRAMPVVQIYASRIAALETQVLVEPRPHADITKELHLLGNDLKVLRRTLVPTQHLIHKLQGAHADSLKGNSQGFLSPLTVVYLSDVLDHISTIVEDMETLAIDARDLIDLVFNTIAHQNNNSMQMLAVVSTIFLPITFIAGVYGTNFDQWFPEIHWSYGYVYFWGICAFVTVLFTALLRHWRMFER